MSDPHVSDRVLIFDTTLRDGEQSPGATMNEDEKIEVAKQLVRLGVDIIEAGFPIASPGDYQAVKRIATEVGPLGEDRPNGPPVIAGLARAAKVDIDRCYDAVRHAPRHRIHTFLATSDIHLKHKLQISREDCLKQIREMVGYAKSLCDDVEFSPEDAGRSDPQFLFQAVEAAIEAGATTVNIPDTVGYTTPQEFGGLICAIRERVPGADQIIISAHCHDDLGLATANTLAAVQNGARQVEVTINGIGERAGNTSLEEVVMALHTRPTMYGLTTAVDTTQIYRASRLVSHYTGIPVQPNKAIVGANAFAHEAGIHQDGMLKHHLTYEIMRPETVGVAQTKLVLGKHSGRHALAERLRELGYNLSREEVQKAFERFKDLCDKKKTVTDRDLEALVLDEVFAPPQYWQLDQLHIHSGFPGIPTATVRMTGPVGDEHTEATMGTGPVDAAYKAIDRIIGVPNRLLEFNINAITAGIDAMAEVSVRVEGEGVDGKRILVNGHGADTDTLVASARAYIAALNRLVGAREQSAQRVTPGVPEGVVTP
ncbi:MAG: 2-isopropylmalate synthase [Anaerolineae bacterium]